MLKHGLPIEPPPQEEKQEETLSFPYASISNLFPIFAPKLTAKRAHPYTPKTNNVHGTTKNHN